MDGLGLYLHVPFCLRKCLYCSFYSISSLKDAGRYAAAAARQIRQAARQVSGRAPLPCSGGRKDHPCGRPLTSIFFGGGTPTLLPAEVLSALLAECRRHVPCAEEAEVSLEVNPATADLAGLQALRQAGFNRLSIGAQSFDDQELRRLGRAHTAAETRQTLRSAQAAGFTNIGLDLMHGLPGQTLHSWQATLDQALQLGPQHLSLYELTVEAGTPLAAQQARGELPLPDEDTALRMLETAQQLVDAAGFRRYEISNYARPGCECRHNLNYWQNGEWLGIGPAASASLHGVRSTAVAAVAEFCRRVENDEEVWQEVEALGPEAAFRESVVIGLRMTAGVSLAGLRRRFGLAAEAYYGATLERLIRLGLIEIAQGHLRLTAPGLLLADTVMAELV